VGNPPVGLIFTRCKEAIVDSIPDLSESGRDRLSKSLVVTGLVDECLRALVGSLD
jgi:hypothetical protein